GPALLQVSRSYHRSWEAEIDGVSVPVLRANHALMAIPLTKSGDQRVLLRYRPAIVSLAARITVATWALVLLLTLAGLLVARRRGARG
ncbi:MAG TPA: hypothetical protein VF252_00280, partial [Gemmatimonadales bacterium]